MMDAMKKQRETDIVLRWEKFAEVLTRKQIAEIERRLSDKEPYASDEEVSAVLDRLTGRATIGRRTK